MIPYDLNNNSDDTYYDPDMTSSFCWDPSLDSIFGTPEQPVNQNKLLKDIQECKSVNDFLRRIGDDLKWEDLR